MGLLPNLSTRLIQDTSHRDLCRRLHLHRFIAVHWRKSLQLLAVLLLTEKIWKFEGLETILIEGGKDAVRSSVLLSMATNLPRLNDRPFCCIEYQ